QVPRDDLRPDGQREPTDVARGLRARDTMEDETLKSDRMTRSGARRLAERAARGVSAAALLVAMTAGLAQARNPHCSGGILYVTQGMRDKDKGDAESYQRQMHKAVAELEQCTAEDPSDAEAMGYLGWAYAEIDSAGPAGKAFAASIAGLTAKGDKKKADWAA